MAHRAAPEPPAGCGSDAELSALLLALERLPDVLWAADGDRLFTYLSPGTECLLGYLPEELIGRSSEIVMHESSREAFEAGYRWQMAHPDGDQTYRVNLRHRDGRAIPVELHNVGTPVAGRYGGGTGSVREITETLRLERELQEQAAELAANRERARLAQELHDSVTQALFTITITAGAARMLLERDREGVQAKLEEISALGQEALAEMRSLIVELRPRGLAEAGLGAALRTHLDDVQRRTGLETRLEVRLDGEEIPSAVEDALYRIAQEAVHNAVKHARGRAVCVALESTAAAVRLEVRDDGVGFDQARPGGYGLSGMAARAARVGGSVEVRSAPGEGTLVKAVIPIGGRTATGR